MSIYSYMCVTTFSKNIGSIRPIYRLWARRHGSVRPVYGLFTITCLSYDLKVTFLRRNTTETSLNLKISPRSLIFMKVSGFSENAGFLRNYRIFTNISDFRIFAKILDFVENLRFSQKIDGFESFQIHSPFDFSRS